MTPSHLKSLQAIELALRFGCLALISTLVEQQRVALPYPVATGAWTDHAYRARFTLPRTRSLLDRFRGWLIAESGETRAWLEGMAAG